MRIDHIAAWTASGQSQREYCAAQGLRYHAFDYWAAFRAASGRACGIDLLSARVLEASVAGLAPHTAYLFSNRSGTRLRLLVWGGLGFWLCARHLERGHFVLPAGSIDAVELCAEQFA